MASRATAFLALALWATTLLACAGASHTMIAADTYSISCKRNAGNCYEEAAKVCPSGFDVVDAQNQKGAVANTNYSTGQTTVTPTYQGQMLVRCRSRNKPAAETP